MEWRRSWHCGKGSRGWERQEERPPESEIRVCRNWESEAESMSQVGVRVV